MSRTFNGTSKAKQNRAAAAIGSRLQSLKVTVKFHSQKINKAENILYNEIVEDIEDLNYVMCILTLFSLHEQLMNVPEPP